MRMRAPVAGNVRAEAGGNHGRVVGRAQRRVVKDVCRAQELESGLAFSKLA